MTLEEKSIPIELYESSAGFRDPIPPHDLHYIQSTVHFDIFNHLIYPLLATKIVDWDNFSDGEEKFLTPNEGFEDCKLHCEEDMHCMQFRFTPKKCTLSHSITLGWKADRSMDSMSGWMMERITQAIASVRCEGSKWI